jgi:hypothetical protein
MVGVVRVIKPVKRSRTELLAAPLPRCPAELEVLSTWYFGAPLHLSCLRMYAKGMAPASEAGAEYEVREEYNSYHGNGWLFYGCAIEGYDYSSDFWAHVIGNLYCGGIASHSYGQCNVFGRRNVKRLKEFEECLRRNESGRLRRAFERLARSYGAGENTATRDSRVLTSGREDGAHAVSNAERNTGVPA